MPYIDKGTRESLVEGRVAKTAGELNYMVTRLVDSFIINSGLSYSTLNTAIGVLEAAKLELYRRVGAPYEDKKMSANGDVYVSNSNV